MKTYRVRYTNPPQDPLISSGANLTLYQKIVDANNEEEIKQTIPTWAHNLTITEISK